MGTPREAVPTDSTPDAGRRIEIQIPHQRPASVFVHASAAAFVEEAYALGFEFDPESSDQTELDAAAAWAFGDLAFGALLTEADAAADLALGRSAIWWTNYLAAAPMIDARLRDALGVDTTRTTDDLLDAIEDVNARLRRDHADPLTDDTPAEVWTPLADELAAIPCPAQRSDEADRYLTDYVGALPDGSLVVWDDHGDYATFKVIETEARS